MSTIRSLLLLAVSSSTALQMLLAAIRLYAFMFRLRIVSIGPMTRLKVRRSSESSCNGPTAFTVAPLG